MSLGGAESLRKGGTRRRARAHAQTVDKSLDEYGKWPVGDTSQRLL